MLRRKYHSLGYSLLELMLAVAVGSIVLAATYASYVTISKQYNRIAAISEVQNNGNGALNFVTRQIRMAGYIFYDDNMLSKFGSITTPVALTDSGDSICCDSITIIYDQSADIRLKKEFYVATKTDTNPRIRNALYVKTSTWNGTSWDISPNSDLVADFIDNFQVIGKNPNSSGIPTIIDISMTFESKTALDKTYSFTSPNYNAGNYIYSANDKYYRDNFYGTIKIKNLQ